MTIRKAERQDAPWIRDLLVEHLVSLGVANADETTREQDVAALILWLKAEYESWVDDDLHLWCHCEYVPNSQRGRPAVDVSYLLPGRRPDRLSIRVDHELLLCVTLLSLLQRIPGGDKMLIDARFINDQEARDHWTSRFSMTLDAVDPTLVTFTTTLGWPQLSAVVQRERDGGRIDSALANQLLRRR